MIELFSDIFACQDKALARLDPRPKCMVALTLILAVVLSTNPVLPLGTAIASLLAMITIRVPLRLVMLRLASPLGIISVLLCLQAFLTQGTPLFHIRIWGFGLVASCEGVWQGAIMACRVLGAMSVVLLLSLVTPAHRIFHALRWFGVPEAWVEMGLLVYRYVFVLLEQAEDVATAQKARLGYSRPGCVIVSMGILAGTLVTRSLDQAMRTHEAMLVRGYRGRYPFGPFSPLGKLERTWMSLGILTIVALYVLLEWYL